MIETFDVASAGGLADDLATLLDPLQEGVSLEAFGGDLRLRIEKDFTPEHLA